MRPHTHTAQPDPSFRAEQDQADADTTHAFAKLELPVTLSRSDQVHQRHADTICISVFDFIGGQGVADIVIRLARAFNAYGRSVIRVIRPLADIDVVNTVLASDRTKAVI